MALSKCLLNPDILGALTTSLGRGLQCLITLSVKKCFPMSSASLPWYSTEPFPCVLWIPGRPQNLPLQLPFSGSFRSNEILPQHPHAQTRQTQIPQLLPTGYSFQSFHQKLVLCDFFFWCFGNKTPF